MLLRHEDWDRPTVKVDPWDFDLAVEKRTSSPFLDPAAPRPTLQEQLWRLPEDIVDLIGSLVSLSSTVNLLPFTSLVPVTKPGAIEAHPMDERALIYVYENDDTTRTVVLHFRNEGVDTWTTISRRVRGTFSLVHSDTTRINVDNNGTALLTVVPLLAALQGGSMIFAIIGVIRRAGQPDTGAIVFDYRTPCVTMNVDAVVFSGDANGCLVNERTFWEGAGLELLPHGKLARTWQSRVFTQHRVYDSRFPPVPENTPESQCLGVASGLLDSMKYAISTGTISHAGRKGGPDPVAYGSWFVWARHSDATDGLQTIERVFDVVIYTRYVFVGLATSDGAANTIKVLRVDPPRELGVVETDAFENTCVAKSSGTSAVVGFANGEDGGGFYSISFPVVFAYKLAKTEHVVRTNGPVECVAVHREFVLAWTPGTAYIARYGVLVRRFSVSTTIPVPLRSWTRAGVFAYTDPEGAVKVITLKKILSPIPVTRLSHLRHFEHAKRLLNVVTRVTTECIPVVESIACQFSLRQTGTKALLSTLGGTTLRMALAWKKSVADQLTDIENAIEAARDAVLYARADAVTTNDFYRHLDNLEYLGTRAVQIAEDIARDMSAALVRNGSNASAIDRAIRALGSSKHGLAKAREFLSKMHTRLQGEAKVVQVEIKLRSNEEKESYRRRARIVATHALAVERLIDVIVRHAPGFKESAEKASRLREEEALHQTQRKRQRMP